MKLLIINIMTKLVLISVLLQIALCRNLQSITLTDITENQSSSIMTVQNSSDLSSKNMKGVQSIQNIQKNQSSAAESGLALISNNSQVGQKNVKIQQTVTKISTELNNSQRQTSGLETKQKILQTTKDDKNAPQNPSPAQLPETPETSNTTQKILTIGQKLGQSASSLQQKKEVVQNKISETGHKNENNESTDNTVSTDDKAEMQSSNVISAQDPIQNQSNQNVVNVVNLQNVNKSITQLNSSKKEDANLLDTTVGNADTNKTSNISQIVDQQIMTVNQSAATTNMTQSNIMIHSTLNKQVSNVSNTNATVLHNNSIQNNETVSNPSPDISNFENLLTNEAVSLIPNITNNGNNNIVISSQNTNLTELNVTTPPANVTAPPANVTAPPANVTTPPANVTAPPANVTAPPANVTTPPANVTTPPSSGIITITFSKDPSIPTNFVITNTINNSSTSFTNNVTQQQPPIINQNTTSTNITAQVSQVSPTMVSLVNVLNSTITLPTTSPNITIPTKLKEGRPQKIIGITRLQDSGFSDDLIPIGLQDDPRYRKLKNIIIPTTVNLQILQLKKFKRSFDGTNNNIANPKWGSTNTPQKRHCGVNYADGRSIPISGLPSPRQTSDAVGAIRKNPQMNKQNVTLAWTIWGQFIDHDMEHSQSSDNEVFHIPIPRCDKFLDSDCNGTRVIPFTRSLFSTDARGVRTPLNALTAWIDASMIYGTSLQQSNKLRSFSQGKLRTDSSGRMLPQGKRVQLNPSDILRNVTNTNISNLTMEAGDSRSNQNLVLLSFQTLFLREHNRICDLFVRNNLGLSDQDAFSIARNYVIGLIQKITYDDYLPALLGAKAYKQIIGPYPGYDDKLDPTIQIQFSAAGFRFGHSIVPLGFPLVNIYGDKLQFLDMDRAFFRPDLLNTVSLDRIFRGIARTVSKLRDGQFVDQLRNLLILAPQIRNIRMDLLAINIQRGRDQGIPAFNTLRQCYGFRRFSDFNQFSDNKTKNEQLSKVYRNINNVDSYISIQLEKGVQGSVLGETGIAIVGKQFQKLRNADRFWYQKVLPPKILAEIKATKLSEIIIRNTAITQLQQDIFHYHFGL